MTHVGARPDADSTDYARIGGGPAVSAVVDHFYDLVLADEQLAPYFTETEMSNLKRHQVQLFSHLLGGPVEYEGSELRAAHADMGISSEAYRRVVGHLVHALSEAQVPDDIMGRLNETLQAVEPDIVSRAN